MLCVTLINFLPTAMNVSVLLALVSSSIDQSQTVNFSLDNEQQNILEAKDAERTVNAKVNWTKNQKNSIPKQVEELVEQDKVLPEKVVDSEKTKCSHTIAIDFAYLLQSVSHAKPKMCDKLQEHLCLCHNMQKRDPFWPTAESIKNRSYKELLNAHDLLFPNDNEDEDIVPGTPPKKSPYIRTKRGGIALTIEELENYESEADKYVLKISVKRIQACAKDLQR